MRKWRQDGRAWVLEDGEARHAYAAPFGSAWDVKVFYNGASRQNYHYRLGLTLDEAKDHAETVLAEHAPA
jgi:hypothetical protein